MASDPSTPADLPSTVAKDPFNDPEADLIIRTYNNVDFRVYKLILAQASPFFRSMFTLPQERTRSIGKGTSLADQVQVIPVSEDDIVIDALLRICYPVCDTPLDPDLMGGVWEAGRKYQMYFVLERAKEKIRDILQVEPVKAYSLAYRFGFEAEARAAALSSLRLSLETVLDTTTVMSNPFDDMTGHAVKSLIEYHVRCKKVTHAVIQSWEWLDTRSEGRKYFFSHHHSDVNCVYPQRVPGAPANISVHSWFRSHMEEHGNHTLSQGSAAWPTERMENADIILEAFLRQPNDSSVRCNTCRCAAPEDIRIALGNIRDTTRARQSQVSNSQLRLTEIC